MTAPGVDQGVFKLPAHSPGFRGWQMVARGFLCQNAANGFLFGTFATTLLATQQRLDSTRATISLGMSLALLTMALVSPLTARMLKRLTLRWTMVCGIALSGFGYILLAIARSAPVLLLAYAVLIGPGIAMFGSLPTSILASNWFVERQGTAVGIVNIALFQAVLPILAILLLESYGLTALYLTLAACHLALLPVALTIVERPALIGQVALGAGHETPTSALPADSALPKPVALLSRKEFWFMVGGGGGLTGLAVIALSHIVAIAVERGLAAVSASLLVSVMGGGAMIGAFLAGVLCDRIGPARVLALAAAGTGVGWSCLYITSWLPPLVLAVALLGVCTGGIYPAISVLARQLFGADAMARAIGLYLPLTLPLMFCAAPIAGWIRDRSASYNDVIVLTMISSAAVCVIFIKLWHMELRSIRHMNGPAVPRA